MLPSAARAQTTDIQTALGIQAACLSPQRAFAESANGKALLVRLSVLQNERARTIEEKNKAVQAQEMTLEQSGALLSESARALRTNEVQKLRIDVQRFIEDAQAELLHS
jgi:Skp family chaperone for outer membrane proteins